MSGIALQGLRCRACRIAAFRSFVALSGVSIPLPLPQTSITSYYASRSTQSCFQSASGRQFSIIGPAKSQADGDLASKIEAKDEGDTKAHIPWYLQDESQKSTAHPLKQQELPALPDNPPPILEKLLHYVSVDAGLDDLTLLDLRSIDPPPALGANLIMIIGTARSIKHLNVAGDRMCRWLRSTYQLKPTADGLLGRNELKIKLRRRARKAKAASESGTTLNSRDDGITTGWICVSVGDIENGPLKPEVEKRPFVGFGGPGDRVRIVVQMLVEDKRNELQLETLWGNLLNGKADEPPKDPFDNKTWPTETGSRRVTDPNAPTFNQQLSTRRHLHTHARSETADSAQASPSDNIRSARSQHPPLIVSTSAASPSVSSLLEKLSQLPEEEARRELGFGPGDRTSTLFLRLFHELVSKSDAQTGLVDTLELTRAAVILDHVAYQKRDLLEAFKSVAASGYDIPEELGMDTIRALLSSRRSKSLPDQRLSDDDIECALQVLDHMSLRGYNILNGEVFFLLHQATAFKTQVRPANISNTSLEDPPTNTGSILEVPAENFNNMITAHSRLSKIMDSANVKFDYKHYPDLLRMYFQHGEFTKFWRLWQQISLMQKPRSKALYLLMFSLHANLGHQNRAVDCITSWVPMMAREEPPVLLDEELAKVVMACILVADPTADHKARDGTTGQYSSLWNQCLRVLSDSGLEA